MRVVHLDCGKSWRGGQQQIFLLHRELLRRGVDSMVLSLRGSELAGRCVQHGLPVGALGGRRPWHALHPRVDRVLRSSRVVHAHDSHAASLAAVACRRHRGLCWVCHRRLSYPRRVRAIGRWKYAGVKQWIAVSEEVRRGLESTGVSAEVCTVIPSALDVDAVRGVAEAADLQSLCGELGFDGDTPVVGVVGALVRQKGHEHLIAAAPEILAAHADVRFLVVGEGRLCVELEDQVAKAGLGSHFRFLGFRRDVPALVQLFRVVVAPSVEGEGSPAALKEAMALGRAVVASDLPAHREVLAGAGLLVAVGDAAGLAESVTSVLADPVRRQRLGERARVEVERFRPELMAESTIEVYCEAVHGTQIS